MQTETIAAISTAMSNGGISIVRMSGSEAISILNHVFQSGKGKKGFREKESHRIYYGYIKDGEELIDEVLVSVMRAPHTYTKEDVVEINCHGGVVVTRKVLETVMKYGARPAEPGEFTKRAFLNGRIDLSQAEAVIDIIQAKSEMALKSSVSQLKGSVHEKIKNIRKYIISDVAFIEAALDDPEHISMDGFSEKLLERVERNLEELDKLFKSADNGRILKEGVRTVILGKPNAGKSSLLNALTGEERAIVTDIEGTTRDTLEETIYLGDLLLNVVDTAGIRNTEDYVEKIGVEKARNSAKDADLVLYVADASVPFHKNDEEIISMLKDKKAIVLLNKTDLKIIVGEEELREKTGKMVIPISAKKEEGIDLLEKAVKDMFFQGEISFNDEVYITNARHKAAIMEGMKSLFRVKESIESGMPEDFYTIDLMDSYHILGEIIGESVGEDLVDAIFHEFCLGK